VTGLGDPLASLLEDVRWHLRHARDLTVLAFVTLAAGVVPMMRLVVGLRSSPTAEDPWGPLDAAVIVAGVLLWILSIVSFSAARRHTRVAATLASWQLVDARGVRVRNASRGRELRRQVERGEWGVVPVDELQETARLAQLLIAARKRPGSRNERVERFGPQVASRYARAVAAWRVALGAFIAVSIGAMAMGVAAIISGGTGRQVLVTTAVLILFAVIVVSPVVAAVLRRSPVGLLRLADPLMTPLQAQDPSLTRAQVAAMLRKPRLYDVWLGVRGRDAR